MAFQPYDNRMYKFKRNSNMRIIYDCMLEIENIEHINKKYQVGFFSTTINQLVIKSELSISQVRTGIKKLIENSIIKEMQKGQLIHKTPSIFYLTEIINRTIHNTNNNTDKSHSKKILKFNKIKALKVCINKEVAQRDNIVNDTVHSTLIKEGLKEGLKDYSLKEKGIEKVNENDVKNILTFRQELELFSSGKNQNDECYFNAMNELEK